MRSPTWLAQPSLEPSTCDYKAVPLVSLLKASSILCPLRLGLPGAAVPRRSVQICDANLGRTCTLKTKHHGCGLGAVAVGACPVCARPSGPEGRQEEWGQGGRERRRKEGECTPWTKSLMRVHVDCGAGGSRASEEEETDDRGTGGLGAMVGWFKMRRIWNLHSVWEWLHGRGPQFSHQEESRAQQQPWRAEVRAERHSCESWGGRSQTPCTQGLRGAQICPSLPTPPGR